MSSSTETSEIAIADLNFIVIDVETTGMSGSANRVTEVACVVVRDGEVRQNFSSLVNPRQFIPSFIENLTGITNAMVLHAPEEDEVFRQVHRLLNLPNAVFVAHNASFDWSFVSNALLRTGLDVPDIPVLCTCKLANRLLPKKHKKNLGAVSQHFGIRIDARHRAFGDAEATAQVLLEFLEELEGEHEVDDLNTLVSFQYKRLKNFHATPKAISKLQPFLDALPNAPGVYFMIDSDGFILYVGKAKVLADRVRSYFQMSAQHPEKIAKMVRKVHSIRWEETGSELGALLLESQQIKKHKPPFNTMSKKIRRYPFLRLDTTSDFPTVEFCDHIHNDGAEYYGPFLYRGMVQEVVQTIERNFRLRLCHDPLDPSPDVRPCFYYHIKKCAAPCAAAQSKESYREEVEAVRRFLSGYSEGVVAMIEHEMQACAERLEFEQAAMLRNRARELRKLFDRNHQGSTAVNKTNLVVIVPASEREKSVELFCLRRGFLAHQQILGRKASLANVRDVLQRLYYQGEELSFDLSLEEVDELRIIAQWVYRKRDQSLSVYVEDQTPDELFEQVQNCIRHSFDPPASKSEADSHDLFRASDGIDVPNADVHA